MKFHELKNQTLEELEKLSESTREEIRAMKFKIANGQLKKVRDMREARKRIARILTILHKGKEKSL